MIAGSGLAKLAAAYLLVAAEATCPIVPAPKVTINFTNNAPVEFNNKTMAELTQIPVEGVFSRSNKEPFVHQGITQNKFDPELHILFRRDPAGGGQICISLEQVAIEFIYTPRIDIASEVKAGSCLYNAVLQHEVRHVNTEIITFNEFLPQLRDAVQAALNNMPPIPPVPEKDAVGVQNTSIDIINGALLKKGAELGETLHARQQMIDTRAEYMRINALCPREQ